MRYLKKDISPQFFDLTFNNILTIKDALEGDYYYCLNVSKDFPKELEGKFWEIKMILHEEWFDSLPSLNDPTGIHDYHLTIPSIRFGVPISEGENKGKIFYNLGQAENMVYTFKLYKQFEIRDIKMIDDDIISNLSVAVKDDKNKFDNLNSLWETIPSNENFKNNISITIVPDSDTFYNLITINLTNAFPLFPYEIAPNKPYFSDLQLLFQSYSEYVPHGRRNLLKDTYLEYSDGRKVKNMSAYPNYILCTTTGPSLLVTAEHSIEDEDKDIYSGDIKSIKISVTAYNEGTDTAYTPIINLDIDSLAEYIPSPQMSNSFEIIEINNEDSRVKNISVIYKNQLVAKDEIKFDLYFDMQFGEVHFDFLRNLENEGNQEKKASIIKGMSISLCLADVKCKEGDSNYGKQSPDFSYNIAYKVISRAVGQISLSVENIGTKTMPIYVLRATISYLDNSYNINDVEYSFKRKIIGIDSKYKQIVLTKNNTYVDIPFKEGEIDFKKNYTIYYKVIGQFPDGRTLDSLNQNEFMDTYSLIEEKKSKFPTYAYVLIGILGAAIVIATGALIYKMLKAKSVLSEMGPTNIENQPVKISKFEKIENTSSNASAIRSKKEIKNKNITLGISNNNN